MAAKKHKPLTREGEPTQRTPGGLEIPIPSRDEFFGGLTRAARPDQDRQTEDSEAPSQSD